jgi:molybdopterin synthase catalytic subunit
MAVTKTIESRQEALYVVMWHKRGYKVPLKLNVTVLTSGENSKLIFEKCYFLNFSVCKWHMELVKSY